MKKIISATLALTAALSLLSGCGLDEKAKEGSANVHNSGTGENTGNHSNTKDESAGIYFSKNGQDMFTERDYKTDYDENRAVFIKLNGSSASASSDSVKISGSRITITEEATYVISGELTDGMLIVNAPEKAKLQLVFDGVDITSESSAALYILEADKVFLTLADGTENSLANGGSFVAVDDNNIDAVLFSKQDLTVNGTGSLTVTSPSGHGIVCKDDLVITGGKFIIHSSSHGLDANDSVRIANADLTVDAGKDAIHSENADDASLGFVYIADVTIKAEAEGDGISAGSYMHIADGTVNLLVGGGSENGSKEHSDSFGGFMGGGKPGGMRPGDSQSSYTTSDESSTSMKGLKAADSILISDGNITVNSADDSIHADKSVTIAGGTFVLASGDDAIHAEDTLTVTAGKIDISESFEGLEALHIDLQGGDISLKASDDGLNAAGGTDQSGTAGGRDGMFGGGRGGMGGPGGMSSNADGSIKISCGTLYINSSGDGIDANGTLEITGGYTVVVGPVHGDTATLDYDISGTISGGTFIGTGAYGMAQSFSESEQGVIAAGVGKQRGGTNIVLKNTNGDTIIEYAPELDFAVVIISSPDIKKGETYTLSIGSVSGEIEAY